MVFTDNFTKIEEVKQMHKGKSLEQKFKMMDHISNISKVVVDSDGINNRFADLVSDYLSKSDFRVFGNAIVDTEIMFVSDAIGHGDCFTFLYDKNKQIDTIKYQTSDKNTCITLKKKNNRVSLTKVVNLLNGSINQKRSTFEFDNDTFYETSYSDKTIMQDNELMTYGTTELNYDRKNDIMTKSFIIITKDDNKVLSKTTVSTPVEKSEYVIEDGLFYIINKKEEKQKVERIKSLENKLVKIIN